MALFEIKGVTKSFGGLTAVNNFDLKIEEGQIVGLVGPNGAGKSTIFNLITGVFSVDSGEIVFDGENITNRKPYQICRKGIGRAFQIVKPFGDMTVIDNLMVGTFCRVKTTKEARQRAMEVLEFVKLDDKMNFLTKNLTIAGKKCLELARALATKPKLLLLDEVMAGLNPKETQDTISLVRKIQESGVSLLIIEHVMRVIMTLPERISIIHHGRKIAEGTPQDVVADEKVIKAYLGERYVLTGA